ncbi:DNA topoisomerase I [Methylomagnum ishizawai]|uniref:DNA topoisomerase 1 n=1 Tax=Methylomagnum ishizawai TaxID=1760988 RepID=A0A1Y6CZP8_9GAMM|nr:type I DNA topoisomerase [Methylomagnum ishizawai]SMF93782.1 DNA topoisomerase I [Methylomagnum ishizawai]
MPNTDRLLIVESPTKTRKIRSLLGPGWTVEASCGHIRDLPEREMGLEPPDFKPRYVVLDRAKPQVQKLKALAKTAREVYLATDPDREGEAIAWHIQMAVGLKNPARVTFHEITEKAVRAAVQAPRKLDLNLVAAQETRRSLDRLVGYLVSPELCRRMASRLSAGRVQSPALRLVVDREREIENFKPITHYGVTLYFDGPHGDWRAHWLPKPLLPEDQDYWTDLAFAQRVAAIRAVKVVGFKDGERRAEPPAPFTTSTLQQAASAKLNLNPKKTMDVAQALFEQGWITYMRTDSPNLSDEAIRDIRAYAQGQNLPLAPSPRRWQAKAAAQEAHEAIRPTHIEHRAAGGDASERALYQLIWERAVASQLAAAVYDVRQVVLESVEPLDGKTIRFGGKGEKLKSAGWLALAGGDAADELEAENRDNPIPVLKPGDTLIAKDGKLIQKQTEPPKRYTQAGLVKALERLGIGRPSTYAAIMEGLVRRGYVVLKGKIMHPTDIGKAVVDLLKLSFRFLEYDFTARMEDQLDEIARGERQYRSVVAATYDILRQEIGALPPSEGAARRSGVPKAQVDTTAPTRACPECGQPMRRINGRNGWFWGCSGYAAGCRATLPDEAAARGGMDTPTAPKRRRVESSPKRKKSGPRR